jgi:hypothetical protein
VITSPRSAFSLFVPALGALLHNCPRRDFFCSLTVAARPLSGLFDVHVLPLLLVGCASQVSFNCHKLNFV